MLFRDYLGKILGSQVKIGILRALYKFPKKTFTTRELAKYIGASHSGIIKAIKNLEKMDVVRIESVGKAYQISLNEKSFITKNILKIFGVEKKTLEHLTSDLKNSFKGAKIISLAIFGSIAKGSESPKSDIDLLIITRQKSEAEEKVSRLQRRFAEKYGNSIAPYIMVPEEFLAKKNTRLVKNIMRDHIFVSGKRLEELYED
jgi:predicted nucleotidyltransferase